MHGDDIARLLRDSDLRVTPQRRAILQAFRGSYEEHLSADEVHSRASTAVPEIGRGTVYATLAELTELGLLASVGSPEPVRYETNLTPHDHFHCRLCLRLFDVELGGAELRDRPLDGYTIEVVAVHAVGVCADCHAYERGLRDGAAHIIRSPTVAAAAVSDLTCTTMSSPLGDLAIAASEEGIVRVGFADHADFSTLHDRARSRRGPSAARRRLTHLGTTLHNYFGGGQGAATDAVDWRFCSPPGVEMMMSVQKIPYAQPLSYDRLASGLSAYDRGFAIGCNPLPILVPCHRVSCGSKRMEAYVGGAERLARITGLEAG